MHGLEGALAGRVDLKPYLLPDEFADSVSLDIAGPEIITSLGAGLSLLPPLGGSGALLACTLYRLAHR